jgi:hypothetical protein
MPLETLSYIYDAPAPLAERIGIPSVNSALIMALSLAVAVGVYRVRPWGFYLFVGHALFVSVNNVIIFSRSSHYPLWLVAVSDVSLFGVLGYFIFSNIRQPFFNPRARWWEQQPRALARLDAVLRVGAAEIRGETLDFSEGGCFVACDPDKLPPPGDGTIEVTFPTRSITSKVQVVWTRQGNYDDKGPFGVGVKFVDLASEDRAFLRRLVREARAGRGLGGELQRRASVMPPADATEPAARRAAGEDSPPV